MLFSTFCLLFGAVAAVDLRQYQTANCNGNTRRECRNVARNYCCRPGDKFRSGSCKANDYSHIHAVYSGPSHADSCKTKERQKSCRNSGNCMSASSTSLRGHKWWFATEWARRSVDGEEQDECLGYVDPDLYVLNGRAFEVNGTDITDEQLALFEHLISEFSDVEENSGAVTARSFPVIPSELEKFETEYLE